MSIDFERLSVFMNTLTEDQRILIRESLGGIDNVDPGELAKMLSTDENVTALARVSAPVSDAGVPDAGTSDGGTAVALEPPLTRW